jgi:ABC-type multidrug transport system ATPase subunit
MNAVDVEHVWKYYGDFPALRDITFQVAKGDCVALLGRNGAGKTTLLRIIAGLSKPARGHVRIEGSDSRMHLTRTRIGVLGHGIAIYDELSAFENLRVFAELYNVPDPKTRAMEWPGSGILARNAPAARCSAHVSSQPERTVAG